MSPPPSSLPISAGLSAQTVGSACQRKKTYPSSLLSACCRPAAQFGGCAVGRHPHGPSSASLHSLPVDQGASELRVDPSSSFGPLPICVTDAIDSGNIQVESLRGDRVELRIKSDPFTVSTDNRSHCQWFHFRASNVKGRPLTFAIRNCKECSFPAAWDGYQTVASYDGEEWFRVTTTTYDDASGTLEWSITPEHSTVSFAYFAPYSYERHQVNVV